MTFEYSTEKLLGIYSDQIDEYVKSYIREFNPICQDKIRAKFSKENKKIKIIEEYIKNNIDILIEEEYFSDDYDLNPSQLDDLVQIHIEKSFSEKDLLPIPNEEQNQKVREFSLYAEPLVEEIISTTTSLPIENLVITSTSEKILKRDIQTGFIYTQIEGKCNLDNSKDTEGLIFKATFSLKIYTDINYDIKFEMFLDFHHREYSNMYYKFIDKLTYNFSEGNRTFDVDFNMNEFLLKCKSGGNTKIIKNSNIF